LRDRELKVGVFSPAIFHEMNYSRPLRKRHSSRDNRIRSSFILTDNGRESTHL